MLITSELGIIRLLDDGTSLICLAKITPSGCCGRMAAFLVNRLGTTRCIDCDGKFQVDPAAVLAAIEELKMQQSASPEPAAPKIVQQSASPANDNEESLEAAIRRVLAEPTDADLEQFALDEYHGPEGQKVPPRRSPIRKAGQFGNGWNLHGSGKFRPNSIRSA